MNKKNEILYNKFGKDDLKKQKFFTWAGDFRWAEVWNEAGYNPIPLASTDILSSLQTGLINTLPNLFTVAFV